MSSPERTALPRIPSGATTDALSEADRDAFAHEAAAAIEAVLDRRCPEMKNAFWTAVDIRYRLAPRIEHQPGPAPRPSPQVPPSAQSRSGSS